MRIVSVGECMIEFSARQGATWRMGFAGDVLNTLWYTKGLLGDRTRASLVSAFGDDHFSTEQIAFLKKNGIGIAASPTIPNAAPGLYTISVDNHGERSFTYWRQEAAARHLADSQTALHQSLIGADLVYFSGITLAILTNPARNILLKEIDAISKMGGLVAFDPNYRIQLWENQSVAREWISRGCAAAKIVMATYCDEQMLFQDECPKSAAIRIASLGSPEIVVKDGSNPALLHSHETFDEVKPDAMKAKDTTGAGDSFNGTYLAARLSGLQPLQAAKLGHQVAATVISQAGALLPMKDITSLVSI
jgi:2-dehydro-3-deoxygluconokinase